MTEKKHFIPLESNPVSFNPLLKGLTGINDLCFNDVLSLDDADLLAVSPRPALALVLVFPTVSPAYEKYKESVESSRDAYNGCGPDEPVMWFKQTIGNACGFYGLLHAVSNGEARSYIKPDSVLSKLLKEAEPLLPNERVRVLEKSDELETIYTSAAKTGDTEAPHPEAEVDFHYICFVKSHRNGHLYQMDGASKGPLDLGPILSQEEDLLSPKALKLIKTYVEREGDTNLNFSLMALGPAWADD